MAPSSGRSLYVTVVAPIILVVLGSMGIVAYSAMRVMREGVRTVAEQRARFGLAYIRNAMEDIEHLMRAEQKVRLQQGIERLGANPDLEAIRLLSPQGKVLYSSTRAEVGALLPAHVTKAPETLRGDQRDAEPQVKNFSGVLHADVPIYNRRRCQRCHGEDRAVLGILDVDVSLSRQTAGMVTWMQMAGIATILQFGLVALGTSLVLSFVVVKPLRRLQKALGEVHHGDYPPSLEGARTQEVTALVVGFNDMLLRVRRGEEAEREAQQARLLSAEQLATMGELASSLAHELRNPLSGIKAAVDVIAAEEQRDEPKSILKSMSRELTRVDGVVKQLLDFARPKTPVLQRVDLLLVLNEAVLASKPRANERRVRLDTELPAHPVRVMADAGMVQQVVLNLVLNAMDAAQSAAGPRVVVSAEVREGMAWCRVRDNGPGVRADLAATLFRPFTTTKAGGTGLGLPTSRRLVEVQGGELRLENPGEPGASFAFSLALDREIAPA